VKARFEGFLGVLGGGGGVRGGQPSGRHVKVI